MVFGKTITVKEARQLIERGRAAWKAADGKVAAAFARYDAVFKKYNNLYVQEPDGHFAPLESPVRGDRVEYYVTDYYPAVYKLAAKTLKPREHKTAYKALDAAEWAIVKAIDRREEIAEVLEECEKALPRVEAIERNWDELCDVTERMKQNRKSA